MGCKRRYKVVRRVDDLHGVLDTQENRVVWFITESYARMVKNRLQDLGGRHDFSWDEPPRRGYVELEG